tara:strand:- start:5536 stop:6918 length:1383 start_codon:yes stop_codon:yes gene_type:complete
MKNNILVVDDEVDIRLSISGLLEDENYEVALAKNSDEALKAISVKVPDLILLDIWLENSKLDGIELLNYIISTFKNIPCIMISGHGNIDIAVKAIRIGASDFIEKPFETERLLITIERVLELSRLKKEHKELWIRAGGDLKFIGDSIEIKKVKSILDKIAPTGSRVFITGESGTGKETLARIIHEKSNRSNAPFVILNPSILLNSNLEEQLFGMEDKNGRVINIGIIEQANGGTLFLDEVTELSIEAQGYLTKVFQENNFKRKNGLNRINIDIRVISSSSLDIKKKIEEKKFSEDFFYRLNVLPLFLPPLSSRKEDIPTLVNYFIGRALNRSSKNKISIDQQSLVLLQSYSWPGNIRQLKNTVERILILIDDLSVKEIKYDMLPNDLLEVEETNKNIYSDYIFSLKLKEARKVFEYDYILKNLDRFDGNISRTANFIGMERSAFHRKISNLKSEKKKNIK